VRADELVLLQVGIDHAPGMVIEDAIFKQRK
jgi:hypothetical protein